MALIYTKLTDKTTVLAPREGACRKFNFGTDWTEIRVGMFCSAIAATGSNNVNVAETLVPAGITDYITFGIKDDSQTYPGQVGSTFLGVRSGTVNVASTPPNGFYGTSAANWLSTGYYGATMVQNATGMGPSTYIGGGATASAATGYCGFFACKIVITNRGLSSQTVAMSIAHEEIVAGADYSASALRTAINNTAYGTAQSIAWNDGAAARAIPDCFWVRVPLYNNALRLSCIRAIRYAP